MVLIGFTVFKEKILSGEKRQTIRKLRKRPIRVGDRLDLYWKLRTKQCESLGSWLCKEVLSVRFMLQNMIELINAHDLNSRYLCDDEASDLARRDGFTSIDEMFLELRKMHGPIDSNQLWQVIRW